MIRHSVDGVCITPGASSIANIYKMVIPADMDAEGQPHEAALYCGTLAALVIPLLPKTIVEIGTQRGMSTRIFLAATGLVEGGEVHSTDIDPSCGEGKILEDLAALKFLDRWHFRCGRSQDLPPIASDVLYVDGDHSYEAVCSDMARYGPLVHDDGLVILDDYNHQWPGKMRWVDERWDVLEPLIVGMFAVIRVTPERRAAFGPVRASARQPLTDMGKDQLQAYGSAFVQAHKRAPGGMSLEVGSRRGGSALLFLKMLESLYSEVDRPLFVTVDPYGGKPYVGGVPGDAEVALYGDSEFTAMKRLLKGYSNHAHFMMRSVDFLEKMKGVRYWLRGEEHAFGRLTFALLDGEHSAETIGAELAALYGLDGNLGREPGWMRKGGAVCVDDVCADPRTKPMIEAVYDATFGTDGNANWAIIRGVK